MAAPWEKYAKQPTAATGPWAKYVAAPAAPAPVADAGPPNLETATPEQVQEYVRAHKEPLPPLNGPAPPADDPNANFMQNKVLAADPGLAADYDKQHGPGTAEAVLEGLRNPHPGFVDQAKDNLQSLASGAYQGAAETGMLPITARRVGGGLLASGLQNVHSWMGGDPVPTGIEDFLRNGTAIDKPAFDFQDMVRSGMERDMHHPQSVQGDYAKTIGNFLPGLMSGTSEASLAGVAGRALGDVVVPAVMSETAGRWTKGTAAEPWARLLAGLTGNLGAGVVRSRMNAGDSALAAALDGTPEEAYGQAQALRDTGDRIGVPLPVPEALQGVTGGGTGLGKLSRVVENAPRGGVAMQRFYAARPAQTEAAVGNALDTIAPQSPNPSTLGPRAAEVSNDAIDVVRRGINDTTRPEYQYAESELLAPQDYHGISQRPGFQQSLERLRNDPVLGPEFRQYPDNSVAIVDAVTKDMEGQATALGNATNQGFSPLKASMIGGGATGARGAARDISPAYDNALVQQEELRRTQLDPLQQGPLGQVANAGTTSQAFDRLLQRGDTNVGGQNEVADAVRRIVAQEGNNPVAAPLVRQGLANRFDAANQDFSTGPNQRAGARFVKDVAGSPQDRLNLDAAVGQLPTAGRARQALGDLLSVFDATRYRMPVGSNTMSDTLSGKDLSQLPWLSAITGGLKSMGGSIVTNANDAAKRAWLGNRVSQLADLFLAPNGIQQAQEIARRGAQRPMAAALGREVLTAPQQYGGQ